VADEIGPLAQMMLDNSELVGNAIEVYGASAVSEFFVNVGTSMAALFETADLDGDKPVPLITGEE
jgi:hypothetical protein